MESLIGQLSALAHPHRLALFRMLVRRSPDFVSAGDITAALGQKPSTTSAHLATLTRAGLIQQKRTGTSLGYQLNTAGAHSMVSDLFNDCCRGRPDLCPPGLSPSKAAARVASDAKLNVLFICVGNSARSILAEAILRNVAPDRFNAYSAGTKPFSELNPLAIEMLDNKGLDVSTLRSKNTAEFQKDGAPKMDFVFTVCDLAANEDCPPWPGQPISAHWGLPDPGKAEGTNAQRRLAFQQTFGALHNRISAFAALPLRTLDNATLQARLDTIGQDKTAL